MNSVLILPAKLLFDAENVNLVLEGNLKVLDMVWNEVYHLFTSSRPIQLASLVAVSFFETDQIYLLKVRNCKKEHTTRGLVSAEMFKEILDMTTNTGLAIDSAQG